MPVCTHQHYKHALQYPVFKLSTGVLIASCFLVIGISLWHDFPLHVPMLVCLRATSHATCPDESTHERLHIQGCLMLHLPLLLALPLLLLPFCYCSLCHCHAYAVSPPATAKAAPR